MNCEWTGLAKKNSVSVFMKRQTDPQREALILAGFGHKPSRKEHVDVKEALTQLLWDLSSPHS